MNTLVFLRRMIISQQPARVDYTVSNQTKSIYYDRSGFVGTPIEVAQALREIFKSRAVSVINDVDFSSVGTLRIFAPQAISSALAGYKFDAETRAVLLSFTMRLPPLMVRLFPMNRYAFQDNASYMKMHMQFQHNGVFRMQHYISQADNSLDEIVRLRVMMATYILGLIAPLSKQSEKSHNATQRVYGNKTQKTPTTRGKKVSLLSKIIMRIRGL
ncbi:MAG: hypothetical protein Q9M17_04285 [Mariprofundus sp.]|nr:hypothetical protein [Mariprofundus sp.]